ncbi:MAG: GNAT family N-acyltransferase [Bacteroidota bacterium]
MKHRKIINQLEGFVFENQGFSAQLCLSKESLTTAFKLRYKAYNQTDEQTQMDDQHELFYDGMDFAPNSRIFLIWYEGKPVASVRSCILSDKYNWAPIESSKYCQEYLDDGLGINQRLLESGRYVVDPDFKGRKSIYAQILLFKAHAITSLVEECSHIITMVRPKHVPFYERMLGFSSISPVIRLEDFDLEISLLACTREKSMEVALSKGMPPYTEEEVERYRTLLTAQTY